jgi:hypothetical protein
MYVCEALSLSLSLSIYIYIYIHTLFKHLENVVFFKLYFDISFLIERPRFDAIRTEAMFLDVDGRAFWKLKGYTGEKDILLQGLFCF